MKPIKHNYFSYVYRAMERLGWKYTRTYANGMFIKGKFKEGSNEWNKDLENIVTLSENDDTI